LHRIVIVGGGFAGLYAARAFRNADAGVTLVDRRNFHVFQPLLYQVATAGLSPGDIAYPLRLALRKNRNTRVLVGEMTGLDAVKRKILLRDSEIGYDTLICATGATHSYFGRDDWAHHAPGLKTIEDATSIRGRLFFAFEAAEREPCAERRAPWLTFVIVGAGPTGVELAGALAEIANDSLRGQFRSIHPPDAQVLLVDASDRVLPPYPATLSAQAERQLVQLGVRPIRGCKVIEVDAGGVTLETPAGRQRIESKTVLWAAGVRGSRVGGMIAAATGAELDRAGRVLVAPDLTVPGHPEILVLGDLAHVEHGGKLVPGVCPAATQMGQYAARLVQRRLKGQSSPPFRYWDKGSLATIGRHAAVADFGRIRFGGLLAWLAWLFIHIFFLIGFQNRFLVMAKWAFQYLTFNRGARLITGSLKEMPRFSLNTGDDSRRETSLSAPAGDPGCRPESH